MDGLSYEQLLAYIQGLYDEGGLSEEDYNRIIIYILANGNLENSPRDLIQVRRGFEENLPNLAQGEVAFTLDTEKLFIGGSNGNVNMTSMENFVSVLEYGARGKGDDETDLIQNCLNENENVFIPPGYYKIDTAKRLKIQSNTHLIISNGATLKAIPTDRDSHDILRIENKENVTIEGGVLIGERFEHLVETGENGTCINVLSSKNVTIKNMVLKEAHGDGIHVGAWDVVNHKNCENITIDNVVCDGNRRQGLSIVGVQKMVVQNSTFKNTIGTAPSAGIDIEPNSGFYVKNVDVTNCTMSNNAGSGFDILQLSSSVSVENVNVSNCLIETSGIHGVNVVASKNVSIANCTIKDNSVEGVYCIQRSTVNISNTTIDNNKQGIVSDTRAEVLINGCTIKNNTTRGVVFLNSEKSQLNSNILKNNQQGVYVVIAPNLLMSNNIIRDNVGEGLISEDAITVVNNSFIDNGTIRNVRMIARNYLLQGNTIKTANDNVKDLTLVNTGKLINNDTDRIEYLESSINSIHINTPVIRPAQNTRPPNPTAGQSVFDISIGKPVWFYNGTWRDATGEAV